MWPHMLMLKQHIFLCCTVMLTQMVGTRAVQITISISASIHTVQLELYLFPDLIKDIP